MRNCTANEGEDLSRWDYEQTMEEDGCPNIYRFLCNNIHSYDHAYREGRTLKSSTNLGTRGRKGNSSCIPSHVKSNTTSVSMSFSKSKAKR